MDRYITQLIEDLNILARKAKNKQEANELMLEEKNSPERHIQDVEQYLHGEYKLLGNITGINPEQLPPPEQLNDEQKETLAKELESFLLQFCFALDFPKNFPFSKRYSFIRDVWKNEYTEMTGGTSHIEFCNYDMKKCPFKGYCNICNEFEE